MSLARVRVKMCGMTRGEDIAHAINLGVDAIGLVFYPKSSRCVSLAHAKILLNDLPPFVSSVAVLVNPDQEMVYKIIEELPIHLLQFHGDEPVEFCQQFNKPFIKAIPSNSEEHIQHAAQEFETAHALLLDTPSETARGGTGCVFDWNIIPKKVGKPYILAGGLNEANVLEAIKSCTPYAVDLCSGIELSPGIKDHGKMSRFMQKILNCK
ncbi:phosphoribosylanthranilate isomerase [Fluoribacter dumoffii]|uniref:N-(5'-phosphoribosyl)anthranilate isomerase n=1 Tax=Fluoribacter dumoffii TaxID=463 RepID=A0A377G9T1_9GAMM|nr:phosphoribosylanthranilate isomerase [Fluoribacter dumoffii]KTC90020.1 N-(5'-phosphoribosyl)anthranilate isomerase [Fluoribacter dumoffii NY 23]MCW8385318.1 phosphoribosylanthranilate isomerase [Fluoribacter dumoffii]MCW8418372.1 phosphoribosylanthranilate isomerase [Fluoribacter dumoffii]MCW8453786.1 phosphoribosylanthranilate isomerase [Fluoribacter dumoffii]MCW8462143.1 phosphoribosylanthranilate isomerase [Fluoribacter dumoffii]